MKARELNEQLKKFLQKVQLYASDALCHQVETALEKAENNDKAKEAFTEVIDEYIIGIDEYRKLLDN